MDNTTPTLTLAQQHELISFAKSAVHYHAYALDSYKGAGRCLSSQDIEEAVCDTIEKAFSAYNSYDPEKSKLSTWINVIARNRVIDALKDCTRRRDIFCRLEVPSQQDDDETFQLSDTFDKKRGCGDKLMTMLSSSYTDRNLDLAEFEAGLRKACGKLSPKNRQQLEWLNDDLSYKEMAELANCSEDAIGKRIWSVRRGLQAPAAKLAMEFGIPFRITRKAV